MARLIAYEDAGQVGEMRVMAYEFTYADAGTPFDFEDLPAECFIDRMALNVEEVFDSGTTDTLDVGTSVDPNGYSPNTETDLRSATGYQTMAGGGALGVPVRLTAATGIRVTYGSTGAAPTTGKAQLMVHYYRLNA
jgi:hypothetical protein